MENVVQKYANTENFMHYYVPQTTKPFLKKKSLYFSPYWKTDETKNMGHIFC